MIEVSVLNLICLACVSFNIGMVIAALIITVVGNK